MDTKHIYHKLWKHQLPKITGVSVLPHQIHFFLNDIDYCKKHGKVCLIDVYVQPGVFEKQLTAYGKTRVNKCGGVFDGCSGKARDYWVIKTGITPYKIDVCKSCHKHMRERSING